MDILPLSRKEEERLENLEKEKSQKGC